MAGTLHTNGVHTPDPARAPEGLREGRDVAADDGAHPDHGAWTDDPALMDGAVHPQVRARADVDVAAQGDR